MELDVIKGFQKWKGKQKRVDNENTPRSYVSYLNGLQKDICLYWNSPIHDIVSEWMIVDENSIENKAKQFAQDVLLNSGPNYCFIEDVDALIKEGNLLYAITLVDFMYYIAIKIKDKYEGKSFDKRLSALISFRRYLKTAYNCRKITTNNRKVPGIANLAKGNLSKIDGIEGLIDEIGEKCFIKYAIEHSYFFDKSIVEERMKIITDSFKKAQAQTLEHLKVDDYSLPARMSKKDNAYKKDERLPLSPKSSYAYKRYIIDNDKSVIVKIHKDGNFFVRQCIRSLTGYTACEGRDSIFQNYIISHLWGCAYDPRYFTNFWNIVLVPAWANSLLDKESEVGSVASKLKATFMSISKQIYDLSSNKYRWDDLWMKEPKVVNEEDKKAGTYTVKLLCKTDKLAIGKIVTETIQIKAKKIVPD